MVTATRRRYELGALLGRGGMGEVYQARDRLTGTDVALKRVTAVASQIGFASRPDDGSELLVALGGEFRTLASLRHPHIISVLDYGFEGGMPFYTMDLLDDPKTLVQAADGIPQAQRVELLVQLLQALAYLHRRDVVHRDVKPGNVLVARDGLRLVDFGISLLPAGHTTLPSASSPAGTLAYVAPEMFSDPTPSPAGDLYAVGVIAYEMLTGRYPFDTSNLALLVNQVLSETPDTAHADVNPQLAAVLDRLLAKSPEDRPGSADDVIFDLCEATGRDTPAETVAIRESFLQAAKFVGRDDELALLRQAIRDTTSGRRSTWLIGGESGVGKSRLVEEARTRALVNGLIAARGQALRETGAPYQVWRDALAPLLLLVDVTDPEASILKPVVPEISRILDRNVADAPPDPQGYGAQVAQSVARLMKRLETPMMLILEDLQWAGSESLTLLAALDRLAPRAPVLMVGTYRNDEAPDLPTHLGDAESLDLDRLSAEAVMELSDFMLGDAGRRPDVQDFLVAETEGNAFFVVEVVRALAEQSGSLQSIGEAPLPERVLTGGIAEIVQRRIERVPSEVRPLLDYAAVSGRHVDPAVLAALQPEATVEHHLSAAAEAAVMESSPDGWRFAHDKLREHLLDNIEPGRWKRLHREVAEAVEATADTPLDRATELVHYWRQAGDEGKELEYLPAAAERAFFSGAGEQAVAHLRRTLELAARLPASADSDLLELTMQRRLANVLMTMQGYGGAEVGITYRRVLDLAAKTGRAVEIIHGLEGLWAYHYAIADVPTARLRIDEASALAEDLDQPLTSILTSVADAAQSFVEGSFQRCHDRAELALSRYRPEEHHIPFVLDYGQDLGAPAMTWMAAALWALGRPDEARALHDTAAAMVQSFDNPYTTAFFGVFSTFLAQYGANPERVLEPARNTVALSEKYGFASFAILPGVSLAWAEAKLGRPEPATEHIATAIAMIADAGLRLFSGHNYAMLADCHLEAASPERALAAAEEGLAYVEETAERFWEAELHRIAGRSLAQLDHTAAADRLADAVRVARAQGARMLELRAACDLAAVARRPDEQARARVDLEEIYGSFTQGFAEPDLVRARTVLGAEAG